LKRDAVANVVQNNLFKKTGMQTTFSANMLALVDDGKQPQKISLRQSLEIFIEFRLVNKTRLIFDDYRCLFMTSFYIHFRFNTVRRRSKYRLDKLISRDHIIVGLLMALTRIDEVRKYF
jgi:DNA gyrase subunit A